MPDRLYISAEMHRRFWSSERFICMKPILGKSYPGNSFGFGFMGRTSYDSTHSDFHLLFRLHFSTIMAETRVNSTYLFVWKIQDSTRSNGNGVISTSFLIHSFMQSNNWADEPRLEIMSSTFHTLYLHFLVNSIFAGMLGFIEWSHGKCFGQLTRLEFALIGQPFLPSNKGYQCRWFWLRRWHPKLSVMVPGITKRRTSFDAYWLRI